MKMVFASTIRQEHSESPGLAKLIPNTTTKSAPHQDMLKEARLELVAKLVILSILQLMFIAIHSTQNNISSQILLFALITIKQPRYSAI